MTTWVVLANEDAGTTERAALGRALVHLAADTAVTVRWTSDPDDVVAAARDSDPSDRLVLFGGDGTISSSVDALVGAGLADWPIGILPGGTGNDFLRGMGAPLDPDEAARLLPGARQRSLAALHTDDRWGINALHVGLGAEASRRASQSKGRLGRIAYPVGALRAGASTPAWTMEVRVDGEPVHHGSALMVAVVMGATIGGGTRLAEQPTVQGASVDVLVATHEGPVDRLRLARALLAGPPWPHGPVRPRHGSVVEIRSDRPLPVNLDGEDLGDTTELRVQVEPDTWTALLPIPGDEGGAGPANG